MSDTEDIEDIREQKREQLQEQAVGGDESPSEPIHLADVGDFETFVGDHDVVLVDFHAEWCGPCQMLEPVVEDLAAETDATVLKVDIDDHQALAGEMGIRGVPTLHLYSDGDLVEQLVGVQEKDRLVDLVERAA